MERRLTAILAADVVGYSRLMGEDEAGTLAALTRLRKDVLEPLIATNRGRVVKLMGDGFLVEFPSVVDAVTCALAWHAAAAQNRGQPALLFRIGVNMGDVMTAEGDIYGDGVNVAARLQAIAEPGGTCISGTVLEHIGNRVDIAIEDLGERQLKNIAKPVWIYRASAGHAGAAPDAKVGANPAPSDKPSIAVLSFDNMSGDPEQAYFSDGITEDIITELSRFRSLFVIARNSSFAYKGRTLDLREIGRELGVRYIAEGSVRRSGERVRVTAQLIDANNATHLWAERYDRDLKDIFSVQDDIAQWIVASLAPRIEAEGLELAKRKAPENMRAYDYCLRASALLNSVATIAGSQQAREFCDAAIRIDPAYARAHAIKAQTYMVGAYLAEVENLEDWRRKALACAETAVALDPMDGVCHSALAEAAFDNRQYDRALDHTARALAINPNDADVLIISGRIRAGAGDPIAGLQQMQLALERNPLSPGWYHWPGGIILFLAGRYEEALQAFNRCTPPNVSVLGWRAVSAMRLGRIEEARLSVRALLALRPDAKAGTVLPDSQDVPDREKLLEDLRQAGLP